MKIPTANAKGFTLVEMLIVLALSGVAMAAIYAAYNSQRKAHATQQMVVEVQQNIRASMYILSRELRMAGYDPTGDAGAGIVTATAAQIQFTMDLDGDGNVTGSNENVTYLLYDSGGDGDMDLGRRVGAGSPQPIARNIDALEFVYLDPNNNVLGFPVTPGSVRSVIVTIVARAETGQQEYTNTTVYRNKLGNAVYTPSANDNFRRRCLSSQVVCRNLSLQGF